MDLNNIISSFSYDNLKKYGYLIKIILVGFGAFVTANIVNSVIVPQFIKVTKTYQAPKTKTRTYVEEKKQNDLEYYEIIIDKNIFDSTNEPVPGAKKALLSEGKDVDFSVAAVPTTLPITLIGTVVFNSPKWSVAVISDSNSKESNAYKVDDIVASVATVMMIKRNKVLLKNAGRLEYVEIKDDTLEVGQKTTEATGVTMINENKFIVSRQEIDSAFADFNNILMQARVVPNFENGKANGFRIFAIQPDSIYQKIGMKDHDIIQRVNGEYIDNAAKAFQLTNALKTEKAIDLEITRDGVKKTIHYDIK